jgi:hypothetical protein
VHRLHAGFVSQSGKAVERIRRLEIDRFNAAGTSDAKKSLQLLAAKVTAAIEEKRMFLAWCFRHGFRA